MSTQTACTPLSQEEITPTGRINRLVLFILFLGCGLAVLIFGSNYFEIFPTNKNLTYNLIVSASLLAAALWLKHEAHWNKYWQAAFAFFIASMVCLVTWAFADGSRALLGWFHVTIPTSQGIAIGKVYEAALVVITILVLTRLSGAKLDSIYLKSGDLRLGLSIGTLVWLNLATSAFLFFATRFTSMEKLGVAVLWGLVFSFANGFMEELWLRGILLKRLQPFLGVGGSILLTSILFALMHAGAMYLVPAALPFLVANTLTLGLACGCLMMKTDSIWGPVLIHAGADLFLFIALLAST